MCHSKEGFSVSGGQHKLRQPGAVQGFDHTDEFVQIHRFRHIGIYVESLGLKNCSETAVLQKWVDGTINCPSTTLRPPFPAV
jgi:hypothetical protein